jgi:probable HAF family extracellular repeat protein
VVVGYSNSGFGVEAFRWTSGGGMVGLGDIRWGSFGSYAYGVSADGSVVVGRGTSASAGVAFRWTSGGSMVGLGGLPGGSYDSHAYGVSADGSVVVGEGNSASGDEAFIWDSTNGMRSLKNVLENDHGLDLTGWTLKRAAGISDDGLIIVGYGVNPSSDYEAWMADLSPAGGVGSVGGAVGGIASMANKMELLAPWITLVALILLSATTVAIRRFRKKFKE